LLATLPSTAARLHLHGRVGLGSTLGMAVLSGLLAGRSRGPDVITRLARACRWRRLRVDCARPRVGLSARCAALLAVSLSVGIACLFVAVSAAWRLRGAAAAVLLSTGREPCGVHDVRRDKSAARTGAWRTPESTLHVLAAIGVGPVH